MGPGTRTISVGILGFSEIARSACQMLEDNRAAIVGKTGLDFTVELVGNHAPASNDVPSRFTSTDDLDRIVNDPRIDVVLDTVVRNDRSPRLVERALRNGKHVVTANKDLIVRHGARLITLAKEKGLDLHYEAAVGGGIPLVQPLKHQLAGNDVLRMMGILNATTNTILTLMEEEGLEFDAAFERARTTCMTEEDPNDDVEGRDARDKISMLASIVFGRHVDVGSVPIEGVRGVTHLDLRYARTLGYRIKHLGIVLPMPDGVVQISVQPTLVPVDHPLASIDGLYNALHLVGDFAGDVMFSGRGSGTDPIASAIVGDLVDIGRNIAASGTGSAIPYSETLLRTATRDDLESAFYLRMIVQDRSGVLGKVATELGKVGVNLSAMEMRSLEDGRGEMVFITSRCTRRNLTKALDGIDRRSVIRVASLLRVER